MTTFLIAGTSAERLGKMQYLISSPLFVTFARAGLFLGPTISYSQESCKGPLKVVTSAVYFHSPRWTSYTWCIVAFLKETRVTRITSKEAGNFLGQKDRLPLVPPELRQQQRSTNLQRTYTQIYESLFATPRSQLVSRYPELRPCGWSPKREDPGYRMSMGLSSCRAGPQVSKPWHTSSRAAITSLGQCQRLGPSCATLKLHSCADCLLTPIQTLRFCWKLMLHGVGVFFKHWSLISLTCLSHDPKYCH